jgi:protein TonB
VVIERSTIAGIDRALAVPRTVGHYLRMVAALIIGAISALALGWFMDYLIRASDMSLDESGRSHMLEFVRIKRTETVERKDRTPPKPQLQETPEVPPMPQDSLDAATNQLAISAMPADAGLDIDRGGIGFGAGEGDYLPIVKVAPIFPQRAAMQGIFGECLVEYTVTAAGTTRDVKVIKDRCTSSVFYRSSVEAAQRFKYKPRIIDGVAVEVEGVLNMFYYRELEQE